MTTRLAKYAPITVEHEWFCGSKITFVVSIFKDREQNEQEDMATWDLLWQVRVDEPDTNVLLEKTTNDDIILASPDPITGRVYQCRITVSAEDTENLDPGTFAHGLKRSNAGAEELLAYGPAVLQQSAVR